MNPQQLDTILQSEYPLHVVGIHTPFEPLRESGSRLLLTADGLLLEACNGIYHGITSLGELATPLALPYGKVPCGVTCLDVPAALEMSRHLVSFVALARATLPNETMMLLVKAPGQPMRCIHPAENATGASLDYLLDQIEPGEHVLLDVHSHGLHRAGFSGTDDKDDRNFRGHLKVCYVIGNADRPAYSYTVRWVSRGHIFANTPLAYRDHETTGATC